MRKKSEIKRNAILDAATEIFRQEGFERASMSEICARVGGSKATLYNYFSSKEELFFEVMFRSAKSQIAANHQLLDPETDDVAETLRRFGIGALTSFYAPEALAARRIVIAESIRSGLGKQFYARGPQHGQAIVSGFMEVAMQKGKLRQADPVIAAQHLRALLDAELVDRFVFHLSDSFSKEEIRGAVERGVGVFMAAYGPRI